MDGLSNYTTLNAEFITKNSTKRADGSLLATSKTCGNSFVQIISYTTAKSLEGSSMRQKSGVVVHAYNFVTKMLEPNTCMVINGVVYANLEVTEIVGNRTKVKIEGYA